MVPKCRSRERKKNWLKVQKIRCKKTELNTNEHLQCTVHPCTVHCIFDRAEASQKFNLVWNAKLKFHAHLVSRRVIYQCNASEFTPRITERREKKPTKHVRIHLKSNQKSLTTWKQFAFFWPLRWYKFGWLHKPKKCFRTSCFTFVVRVGVDFNN